MKRLSNIFKINDLIRIIDLYYEREQRYSED